MIYCFARKTIGELVNLDFETRKYQLKFLDQEQEEILKKKVIDHEKWKGGFYALCLWKEETSSFLRVYFDAKAKLHLQNYLKCRHDNNPALFVTLNQPNKRLKISGVEIRLRMLGRKP